MNIDDLLEKQRNYFRSGATLPVDFRIQMLKKLRKAVEKYEAEISRALKEDLGKSGFESYMCETGLVISELNCLTLFSSPAARMWEKKCCVMPPRL